MQANCSGSKDVVGRSRQTAAVAEVAEGNFIIKTHTYTIIGDESAVLSNKSIEVSPPVAKK